MKEHPIIFNTAMVQAILAGRKTQTRRIIKPQPDLFYMEEERDDYSVAVGKYCPVMVDEKNEVEYPGDEIFGAYTTDGVWGVKCPYGEAGDRLWVRETWSPWADEESQLAAMGENDKCLYKADYRTGCPPLEIGGDYHWHPSIHMPREYSRIDLEITDIRAERLQDISEADIKAEGISPYTFARGVLSDNPPEFRWAFIKLWDSINAKRGYGWEANPWVWPIKFKAIKGG